MPYVRKHCGGRVKAPWKGKVRKAKETVALAATPLGRVVTRLQKRTARLVPELKHNDTFANTISIDNEVSNNNSLRLLENISQGIQDIQRIGDQIRLKSLHIRGQFVLVAGQSFQPVRMVIWMDKSNPDGAASYLTRANQYFTSIVDNTAFAPFALKDWDNRKSFITLYDKTFVITSQTPVGATPDESGAGRTINLKIPLKNRLVQYNNAQTSEITKNNLYVSFYTSVDDVVNFNYCTRVTFTDA